MPKTAEKGACHQAHTLANGAGHLYASISDFWWRKRLPVHYRVLSLSFFQKKKNRRRKTKWCQHIHHIYYPRMHPSVLVHAPKFTPHTHYFYVLGCDMCSEQSYACRDFFFIWDAFKTSMGFFISYTPCLLRMYDSVRPVLSTWSWLFITKYTSISPKIFHLLCST